MHHIFSSWRSQITANHREFWLLDLICNAAGSVSALGMWIWIACGSMRIHYDKINNVDFFLFLVKRHLSKSNTRIKLSFCTFTRMNIRISDPCWINADPKYHPIKIGKYETFLKFGFSLSSLPQVQLESWQSSRKIRRNDVGDRTIYQPVELALERCVVHQHRNSVSEAAFAGPE